MIAALLVALSVAQEADPVARIREERASLRDAVEAQLPRTVRELLDGLRELEAARERKDPAAAAELARRCEALDRRYRAETDELTFKASRLLRALATPDGETEDLRVLELRAELSLHVHDPRALEGGLRTIEQILRLKPDRAPYRLIAGELLRRSGRPADARRLLEEVLKHHPDDPVASAYRALVLHDLGEYAEARRCLREAAAAPDARPGALSARVLLVQREEELREREDAAGTLPRVRLVTSKGALVVELFRNHAPNAVENFKKLASSGFYDGTRFHRVERNFAIQGGDPNSRDSDVTNDGLGGPGYAFADELAPGYRRHFRGSLSMANSGPDTNGSQFFIVLGGADPLDGRHTVFGRVVEGLGLLDRIELGDELREARVVR